MTIGALVIAALVLGRDILVPFALAVILSFILAPMVRWLSANVLPRWAAAAVCVTLVVATLAIGSYAFSTQLLSLTGDLTQYRQNILAKVRSITGGPTSEGMLRRATQSIDSLGRDLRRELQGNAATGDAAAGKGTAPVVVARDPDSGEPFVVGQLQALVASLAHIGLMLLFTIFLLVQYQDLRDRIARIAGTDNLSRTAAALSEAGGRLSGLFTMQAVLNGSFGLLVGLVLAIIGVPSATLWGASTALLRFVPFIGSFLAAVPPLLLAAAVDPGWTMFLATAALFVIGEPVMGHIVEPMVLGKSAGLSPLAFVAAVSFWTLIWGPIGLIVAAPLTMTLVVLGQFIPRFEFMSILLGDEPALAPEQELYHRLLSGDALSAYDHFVDRKEEASLAEAVDAIVMPALELAGRDQRSGRITDQQIAALESTMADFLDLVEAEVGSEDEAGDGAPVLLLPARGPIDRMAVRFLATALTSATGRRVVAIEKGAGLMALASARAALAGAAPGVIVVATVGGLDRSFTRLIQRRAARDYPGALVVSYHLATTERAGTLARPPAETELQRYTTFTELAAALGAAQTAHEVEPAGAGALPMLAAS